MNKEIAKLIEQWLENFENWDTAYNYNLIVKRMVRLELIPNLYDHSIDSFYRIDHQKVIESFKEAEGLTPNNRRHYSCVYNSLLRYIKAASPDSVPCCIHKCKRLVKG